MKNHMKKLTAAVMAVAMLLSLAVSASAQNIQALTDTGNTGTSSSSVVNQGAKPTDIINVMMPTSADNAFDVLFDAHQLIKASSSGRYKLTAPGANNVYYGANGRGTTPVFEEGARFYFKNVTETPSTAFISFTADTQTVDVSGAVTIPAGSIADVYVPKSVKKVYYNPSGTTNKWYDDQDDEVTYSGEYADIVTLQTVDLNTGAGQDTLAKVNKDKQINFERNGSVVGTDPLTNAKGLAEYKFYYYNKTDSAKRYVVKIDNADVVLKESSTAGRYEKEGTNDTIEKLTTAGYDKLPVNLNVISYSGTSDKVTVINKSNATIGLSMKAELSGVPGGDGSDTDSDNVADSVVYAASMDNGDFLNAEGEKIADVPAFYFAMQNGVEADTAAMTYDSTETKGAVLIDTKLAGKPELFDTVWNPAGSGAYEYNMKSTAKEADFNAMNFTLTGKINEDDAWDSVIGSGAQMVVTWTVKTYKPTLATPSLSAGAMTVTKNWTVTISDNKDNATVASIVTVKGTTESALASTAYTVSADGTSFYIKKDTFTAATKPDSIKVTFKAPDSNPDLKGLTVVATQEVT